MKRLELFSLLCCFVGSLFAQGGNVQGVFDVDSFPRVSFIWHEYDHHPLPSDVFSLKEGGVNVSCSVEKVRSLTPLSEGREIIILWEDMYCNGNMFDFSRNLLSKAIQEISLSDDDEVYIAAFNRLRNGRNILTPVTSGFVRSRGELSRAVSNYSRSTETFAELSNKSDVYPAIIEALSILQKRNSGRNIPPAKAVFVITAGRALESSATNTAVEVQNRALEAHIPLFVIQYAAIHGKSSVMEGLGPDTHGKSCICDAGSYDTNLYRAKRALIDYYDRLPVYYNGQNYRIAFTSNVSRNSGETAVELKVNGNRYQLSYLPAGHTFFSWCVAHWIICCLIVLLTAGLTVGAVLYIRKQQQENDKSQSELLNLQQQQQQAADAAAEQAQRLEQMKAQAEQLQQQNQQFIHQRQQQEKEDLLKLMQQKNLYPRFQFADANGNAVIKEMQKLEVLIGRGTEADIRIDNNTVSRKHAKVRFNGIGFEIEDLGSKNGVIVNGKPVTTAAELKDHDIINLGTALITFAV